MHGWIYCMHGWIYWAVSGSTVLEVSHKQYNRFKCWCRCPNCGLEINYQGLPYIRSQTGMCISYWYAFVLTMLSLTGMAWCLLLYWTVSSSVVTQGMCQSVREVQVLNFITLSQILWLFIVCHDSEDLWLYLLAFEPCIKLLTLLYWAQLVMRCTTIVLVFILDSLPKRDWYSCIRKAFMGYSLREDS